MHVAGHTCGHFPGCDRAWIEKRAIDAREGAFMCRLMRIELMPLPSNVKITARRLRVDCHVKQFGAI